MVFLCPMALMPSASSYYSGVGDIMPSKYVFGMPPHRCQFCKCKDAKYTIGTEYEPYVPANSWMDYDLVKNRVIIEAILDHLTIEVRKIPVKKGQRLDIWRLNCPNQFKLEYGMKHFLEKCYDQKKFRDNPTFDAVVKRMAEEKAKHEAKKATLKVAYTKNKFICSEECFNLWVLKNGHH
jgi:hypothetical protein